MLPKAGLRPSAGLQSKAAPPAKRKALAKSKTPAKRKVPARSSAPVKRKVATRSKVPAKHKPPVEHKGYRYVESLRNLPADRDPSVGVWFITKRSKPPRPIFVPPEDRCSFSYETAVQITDAMRASAKARRAAARKAKQAQAADAAG